MTVKDIQQSSLPDGVEDAAESHWKRSLSSPAGIPRSSSLYGQAPAGILPAAAAAWRFAASKDDFADLQDNFQAALQADYREAAANLRSGSDESRKAAEQAESYASIVLAAQEDARAIIEQAKGQARAHR